MAKNVEKQLSIQMVSKTIKKSAADKIRKIAGIDIYDPCICYYKDPNGEYLDSYIEDVLETFFEDLDSADSNIRLYLETSKNL